MRGKEHGRASDKGKEEAQLPGAYIRSLVKHLNSTTTTHGDGQVVGKWYSDMQQESGPQAQHKRQARKRQHMARPCQERLLNMAEARREVFTALKFHRASMKQKQQRYLRTINSFKPSSIHPTISLTKYLQHPYPSNIAPPPYHQNLNFTLPNQTSPNFQDVNNPFSVSSSSSASASSLSSAAQKAEEVVASPDVVRRDLHLAMDDEEMKEIISLGEQHQMEWNDTVNLLTLAQWLEFLKSMEIGVEDATIQNDGVDPPNQITEFLPLLMNTNESSSFQQHHFSNDYFQDDDLFFMDIGEVEGNDGKTQD